MIVDVERTAAAATSRVLHTAKLDGVLAWDGFLNGAFEVKLYDPTHPGDCLDSSFCQAV